MCPGLGLERTSWLIGRHPRGLAPDRLDDKSTVQPPAGQYAFAQSSRRSVEGLSNGIIFGLTESPYLSQTFILCILC